MGFFEDSVSNGGVGENSGFAKTLFVGSASAGYQTSPPGDQYDNPAPTLESLLRNGVLDTADRGTRIVVRKGSALSITGADFFALMGARKRILVVGEGEGDSRPSITWTAAAASLLMDVDDFVLRNLRLFLAGAHAAGSALTVAAPIAVTGASCAIDKCEIWAGFDVDQIVTIGITTAATANRFKMRNCIVRANAAAVGTTFLRLVGGADINLEGNDIVYPTSSAAIGVVQALTTPPTNLRLRRNYIENNASGATAAVTFMANATGHMYKNTLKIAGAGLAHVTTPGSVTHEETRLLNAVVDGTAEKIAAADFGTAAA